MSEYINDKIEIDKLVKENNTLRKILNTAVKDIEYLRLRLSNYEDPNIGTIGTYDRKDNMIHFMERKE